jgi:hypothetical protein
MEDAKMVVELAQIVGKLTQIEPESEYLLAVQNRLEEEVVSKFQAKHELEALSTETLIGLAQLLLQQHVMAQVGSNFPAVHEHLDLELACRLEGLQGR